jgi:phage terminase small subunit
MNPKQRKFCKLYLQGIPAGRAYEQAGYEQRGGNADMAASRMLASNDKVKKYIKSMNEKTDKRTILSITERKELLTRIALRQEGESPSDAIRASAELSKMDGAYEPQKQEVNTRIIIGGDAE